MVRLDLPQLRLLIEAGLRRVGAADGKYVLIRKIIADYGLDEMMKRIIGKVSSLFLDLAAYSIIPENNAGQDYPIFNYAIAYDRDNRESLFYEEYPGSIVDMARLQIMLDKAKSYGYKNCGFILDRGYFSKANLQFMDKNGYDFVIMVKGMKSLVKELILEKRGIFEEARIDRMKKNLNKIYGKVSDMPKEYRHYFKPVYHHEGKEDQLLQLAIER